MFYLLLLALPFAALALLSLFALLGVLAVAGGVYVALRVERAWQVARGQRHQTYPRPALPPDDAGQDRAISSLDEKPDPAGQLLPARTARTEHRGVRQLLQQLSIPREPGQPDAG